MFFRYFFIFIFVCFFVCLFESSFVFGEQFLHSGAEEGGLHHSVRVLEECESFGINRAILAEVSLGEAHSTDGVSQPFGESRTGSRGAMSAQDLQFAEDVIVVLDVRPQQVHLGVVRVSLVMVFGLVAVLALLRALESEGSDDDRLGFPEGGLVAHLESVCRLICLPRTDYRIVNLILGSLYLAGHGCYKVIWRTIFFCLSVRLFICYWRPVAACEPGRRVSLGLHLSGNQSNLHDAFRRTTSRCSPDIGRRPVGHREACTEYNREP